MEWATLPTNFSEAWMSLRKVMIIVANGIPSKVLEGSGDASRRSRTRIDQRLQGPETGQQAKLGGDWTPSFEIADAVGMLARRWRRYGALLTVALRC